MCTRLPGWRIRISEKRTALVVAAAAVRAGTADQPFHRAAAAAQCAVPAPLHGVPLAAASRTAAAQRRPLSFRHATSAAISRRPSAACRLLPRSSKSCSSRAIRSDETWDEIERVAGANPQLRHQGAAAGRQGQGRRGAQGFRRGDGRRADDPRRRPDHAAGGAAEILCSAIESGKGEFVNGTRLVYPMEHEAMRFLNLIANKCFRLPVHLAAGPALHRHAVRHQGAAAGSDY